MDLKTRIDNMIDRLSYGDDHLLRDNYKAWVLSHAKEDISEGELEDLVKDAMGEWYPRHPEEEYMEVQE